MKRAGTGNLAAEAGFRRLLQFGLNPNRLFDDTP
jgi:hypothetical protein